MDHSVEIKLVSLFKLQQIESEIDRLRTYRGELPMEVRDLEDELAGMEIPNQAPDSRKGGRAQRSPNAQGQIRRAAQRDS
jgi:hypothetical protein